MNRPFFKFRISYSLALFVAILATENTSAQDARTPQRDDFVSDVSFVVGTFQPTSRNHSPTAMADAANAFLKSLNAKQKSEAVHDLQSKERREWTNLPARKEAGGVKFSSFSDEQTKLACQLMANLFSEQGYNKIRDIMLADDQLLDEGRPRNGLGTANFAIVIFGKPSPLEPWAFQIDGHHVGVNLAFNGEAITMSPSFIGTQPNAFSIAGKQFKPFEQETDQAHALVGSLTDGQIRKAILGPDRMEIVTGPGKDNFVPEAKGVDCSTFSDAQKKQLLSLISQWVNDLPPAQAEKRMKQIESEIDKMKFSWNGDKAPKSDVSYVIQSPSLIIEYACQSLGGNPLAHLHSNYRDPTNDYGKQLK
ncbi:MAG: DUF3500 domain-containing protein [Mariniblastus sp.]